MSGKSALLTDLSEKSAHLIEANAQIEGPSEDLCTSVVFAEIPSTFVGKLLIVGASYAAFRFGSRGGARGVVRA